MNLLASPASHSEPLQMKTKNLWATRDGLRNRLLIGRARNRKAIIVTNFFLHVLVKSPLDCLRDTFVVEAQWYD